MRIFALAKACAAVKAKLGVAVVKTPLYNKGVVPVEMVKPVLMDAITLASLSVK